jgi:hypothetical protein
MVNGHIYQQIFAGVRNAEDLRHAIARAVRQLREAMEKEDNAAVTAAHVRSLAELDPAVLARAYALAEKTCTFWPTPGQIRELTGWTEEASGSAALQWVLTYLEKHGCAGRARGGGVHFGEDGTGRRVLLSTDPVIPAPPIPAEIDAVLAQLGNGSAKQGLHYVSQHPVVKGWDNFSGDAAWKTAERIEGRWNRAYLCAMRRTTIQPPLSTIQQDGGSHEQ